MFCAKCGYNNPDDSSFCLQCGTAVATQAAPAQTAQQPQYPATAPRQYPKKKTGLIVGIIIVIVLLAAAAAVYFFVLDSPAGNWYCAQRAVALYFGDNNTATQYTLSGTNRMKYEFNKLSGAGYLISEGSRLSFKVSGNTLELDSNRILFFERLDKHSHIGEVMLGALNGVWTSDGAKKALEIKDGKADVYTANDKQTGMLFFNLNSGEFTLNLGEETVAFKVEDDKLNFEFETFSRADKNFNIEEFISTESAITGTWYETQDKGFITFFPDGTLSYQHNNYGGMGTYVFDESIGGGSFQYHKDPLEQNPLVFTYIFHLEGERLVVGEQEYTRTRVELPKAVPPVLGAWYETTGMHGTLEFFEDNTASMSINNNIYYGFYIYYDLSGFGQFTVNYPEFAVTYDFLIAGETLTFDDFSYTKNYVEQKGSLIFGTWSSVTGVKGTFFFSEYGNGVYYDIDDKSYNGIFTFDTTLKTGIMTFEENSLSADFYLQDGELIVWNERFARDIAN